MNPSRGLQDPDEAQKATEAAAEASGQHDPVVDAAKRMATLYHQGAQRDVEHTALVQAGSVEAGSEDDIHSAIMRGVYAAEDEIVARQAITLVGALAQTILAASLLDYMSSLADSDSQEKVFKKIVPLLWSIRGALEKDSGVSGKDFAARYYMPDHLNPLHDAGEVAETAREPAPAGHPDAALLQLIAEADRTRAEAGEMLPGKEFDALWPKSTALLQEAMDTPVRTVAALAWKLGEINLVIETEAGVTEGLRRDMQTALADAERLARGAGT